MTDDVKDLLGRALGQEPPLRIDRDEVIQQGRKRLRRRRLFEASGVVAAVMVVAVGAATLTNLAGSDEPDRMPPAASRTQSAPPGPLLPLPAPTTITSTTPSYVPGAPSSGVPTPSVLNTDELTQVLYDAGIVTQKDVQAQPGAPNGVPAFQSEDTQFVYRADVLSAGDSGSLDVTIDFTPGASVDCAEVPPAFGDCEVRGQEDLPVPVAVSEWRGADGERRTLAFTVVSNGIRVAAVASNISALDRKLGKTPPDTPPVLTADELCSLVVKVATRAS